MPSITAAGEDDSRLFSPSKSSCPSVNTRERFFSFANNWGIQNGKLKLEQLVKGFLKVGQDLGKKNITSALLGGFIIGQVVELKVVVLMSRPEKKG